ncbi:MAG TPA: TlpA disulfide reductase family protein [Thermoanaerobaculia bacterium]
MRSAIRSLIVLFVLAASSAAAQEASPAPTPVPTPPPNIDVRMIRYKISAGDLPSAESILEYHKSEEGEDGDYTMGAAWVARGAALLGDWKAASEWAKRARKIADAKLSSPADYEKESEAVYALGTSIEVEAQALAAAGKKQEAIALLEAEEKKQETAQAPYNLRARIWKRRNLLELTGKPAPAIHADDHVGVPSPTLESLRGKPVVLFFWWEACGDCRMQSATFHKVVEKYRGKDVVFVAPTRYYGKPDTRAEEKGKIEKSWRDTYELMDEVPVPISDAAMLRYGVSATPTFVFVDRKGIVRLYSPTRMSEDRLSAEIEKLLR